MDYIFLQKLFNEGGDMAVYFKPIPTLTGKVAEAFLERSEFNERERLGSVPFKEQAEKARKILNNSKIAK